MLATGSDSSASDSSTDSWLTWFLAKRGNEFFVEVDRAYMEDNFNLYGLRNVVPYFEDALDTILDVDFMDEDQVSDEIEEAAQTLYGLIHARYVIAQKYRANHFGTCPRVLCGGHRMLPVGRSDVLGDAKVCAYCPLCEELYVPSNPDTAQLDGAFFTTSLPHLLMMSYPELKPRASKGAYEPRVYGYRLNKQRFAEWHAQVMKNS